MTAPAWQDDLRSLNPRTWDVTLLEGVLGATMVLVISFGFSEAQFKIASQLAVFACFIRPALIKSPALWFGLAVLATWSLIATWIVADNHKYLFAYWLWVVFFAVAVRDESLAERILRFHARFFVVFVFLAAALQKLSSATYMSGEMFEFKLLTDSRFLAFAKVMGMDTGVSDSAKLALVQLRSPATVFPDNTVLIPSTDWVRSLAKWITWYDLVVQIVIGVLFAIRWRTAEVLGHAVLLFFIFTTYIPAPVFGFGWTLAIYGFVLAKDRFPRITVAYIVTYLAILLYQLPWREWVLHW